MAGRLKKMFNMMLKHAADSEFEIWLQNYASFKQMVDAKMIRDNTLTPKMDEYVYPQDRCTERACSSVFLPPCLLACDEESMEDFIDMVEMGGRPTLFINARSKHFTHITKERSSVRNPYEESAIVRPSNTFLEATRDLFLEPQRLVAYALTQLFARKNNIQTDVTRRSDYRLRRVYLLFKSHVGKSMLKVYKNIGYNADTTSLALHDPSTMEAPKHNNVKFVWYWLHFLLAERKLITFIINNEMHSPDQRGTLKKARVIDYIPKFQIQSNQNILSLEEVAYFLIFGTSSPFATTEADMSKTILSALNKELTTMQQKITDDALKLTSLGKVKTPTKSPKSLRKHKELDTSEIEEAETTENVIEDNVAKDKTNRRTSPRNLKKVTYNEEKINRSVSILKNKKKDDTTNDQPNENTINVLTDVGKELGDVRTPPKTPENQNPNNNPEDIVEESEYDGSSHSEYKNHRE